MSILDKHHMFEKNATLLLVGSLVVVSVGGIVEIAPLFYLENTIEDVEGMRPYTPLELAGREIYIREGCYVCHSQMIRPMRDEVERYGHYSLAAESMYDHPFQWGSKRTGPDLARVGGRYSDEWHVDHFTDPQSVVEAGIDGVRHLDKAAAACASERERKVLGTERSGGQLGARVAARRLRERVEGHAPRERHSGRMHAEDLQIGRAHV